MNYRLLAPVCPHALPIYPLLGRLSDTSHRLKLPTTPDNSNRQLPAHWTIPQPRAPVNDMHLSATKTTKHLLAIYLSITV